MNGPPMRPKRRSTDQSFWTQTGVIPRWQLVAVYMLIVAAGGYGIKTNNDLAHRIQDQRYDATLQNCRDLNTRHDEANSFVRSTHRLTAPAKVFVIDYNDLAIPKRDCRAFVEQVTGMK